MQRWARPRTCRWTCVCRPAHRSRLPTPPPSRLRTPAYAMNEQLPGESIEGVSVLAGNVVSPQTGTGESNGSHLAGVRLHLNERPTRQASPAEIERAWRENIGALPHLERMQFQTTYIRTGPNVAYALKHDDAETLGKAAAELRSFLATVPGVYEIADSLSPGKRHLQIQLTPAGGSGGTDAGRDRDAVARQLPRRGGPANTARPRRTEGHGAVSEGAAAQSARAGRRARPPGRRRRGAVVGGREPEREP